MNITIEEEIEGQVIHAVENVAEKSLYAVKNALDHIVDKLTERPDKPEKSNGPKVGKQSLKELIGQGKGAARTDLRGEDKALLQSILRKYGVDYAIVKQGKNRYDLYFKAQDNDALEGATRELTRKMAQRDARKKMLHETGTHVRESLRKRLEQAKAKCASQPKREPFSPELSR